MRPSSVSPAPNPLRRIGPWAGVILALIAATGFAAKGILVKFAYADGATAEPLLAARMTLAALVFFAVRVLRTVPRKRPLWEPWTIGDGARVVLLGFLGYYLASWLDFLGLQFLSASLERLILLLYPTITIFFGWILFRQRPGLRVAAAVAIGYAGVALVFARAVDGSPSTWRGALLVFGSAVSYALYLALSPGLVARLGSLRFAEEVHFVSAAFVVTHALVHAGPSWITRPTASVWGWGAVLALFSTAVPIYALAGALRRIGSASTSALGMAGPVLAMGMAAVFLGDRLGFWGWTGALVAVFGVSLAARPTPRGGGPDAPPVQSPRPPSGRR